VGGIWRLLAIRVEVLGNSVNRFLTCSLRFTIEDKGEINASRYKWFNGDLCNDWVHYDRCIHSFWYTLGNQCSGDLLDIVHVPVGVSALQMVY
jgi:hypothetical protein